MHYVSSPESGPINSDDMEPPHMSAGKIKKQDVESLIKDIRIQ
jgi:hypothetical protein